MNRAAGKNPGSSRHAHDTGGHFEIGGDMFGMKKPCPHIRTRGIYGDEIIWGTPNWNRLQCLDCNRFLDGDVRWSGDHRYCAQPRA